MNHQPITDAGLGQAGQAHLPQYAAKAHLAHPPEGVGMVVDLDQLTRYSQTHTGASSWADQGLGGVS